MDEIQIEQYLDKEWVRLVTIDVEENATKEEALEAITKLTTELGKSESLYLNKENGFGIIITRSNGPVRMTLLPYE